VVIHNHYTAQWAKANKGCAYLNKSTMKLSIGMERTQPDIPTEVKESLFLLNSV